MKVAFVVGHRRSAQGATAVDGIQEWSWHTTLADQCAHEARKLGMEACVFLRPDISSYGRAMAQVVRAVNAYDPDLVISLHFNAFPEPAGMDPVHGTMALHWPSSSKGRRWAEVLAETVAKAQGTRNKGARSQAKSWNGAVLYILRDTLAPAVILETHYGDHEGDHRKATAARDSGETALRIARACRVGV